MLAAALAVSSERSVGLAGIAAASYNSHGNGGFSFELGLGWPAAGLPLLGAALGVLIAPYRSRGNARS